MILEQSASGTVRVNTLQGELTRLEAELRRYAEAVADAGPFATILQAVKAREQRRDAIRAEIKTLGTPRPAETRDTATS